MINFAKGFKELGHDVEIIAPFIRSAIRHDKSIKQSKYKEGININFVPVINLKYLRPLSFLFLSPIYILFYLFKKRTDVVICFDLCNAPFIVPVVKAAGFPVLLYLNSIISEDMEIAGRNRLLIWLVERCYRMNVRISNLVAVVAVPIREYIIEKKCKTPDKVEVIRDAVDTEHFKVMDKEIACRELGLSPSFIYIGFVGSLCPWHGVDYLIKAAPLILKEDERVRFIIVGDGRMRKELSEMADKRAISDKIIWTGFVPYEKVPLYIAAFNAAVVFFKPLRRNYGSPMKIFEYLACGRAVIASPGPEYGDFVEELGAGLSIDPENSEDFAKKVISLIKDKERLRQMGNNGREEMVKKHTWKTRAKEIEELLK
ncbi:MAG: glycosyltransferase family 4 protein [Candidatus Schekmanbacteria bacterium]|nr:glycosyltransferase family 4 protein [Candidatus Schekmanbacteria bacterium]